MFYLETTGIEEDDYKKIKYFLMGLNSYNKYLRRKLRLEIKDIKKIHSKFVYAKTTEKHEIIKSVRESVEVGTSKVFIISFENS